LRIADLRSFPLFVCPPSWRLPPKRSLYFSLNEPRQHDFGDLARLLKEFGVGEFSFELWVKPDHRYPVGDTPRGTIAQLTDWSDEGREPYSHPV
jgi:hypothetical protein